MTLIKQVMVMLLHQNQVTLKKCYNSLLARAMITKFGKSNYKETLIKTNLNAADLVIIVGSCHFQKMLYIPFRKDYRHQIRTKRSVRDTNLVSTEDAIMLRSCEVGKMF